MDATYNFTLSLPFALLPFHPKVFGLGNSDFSLFSVSHIGQCETFKSFSSILPKSYLPVYCDLLNKLYLLVFLEQYTNFHPDWLPNSHLSARPSVLDFSYIKQPDNDLSFLPPGPCDPQWSCSSKLLELLPI